MVKKLTDTVKKESGNPVKARLVAAGIKQKDICDELAVTPATVSQVVSGKKNIQRVRRAIADALGVRVAELWPPAGKDAA